MKNHKRENFEFYIIRIYRHENNDSTGMVGLVEKVGDQGKKPFKNQKELWEILNNSEKAPT